MNRYKLKDLLSIQNGKDYKHLNNGNIPVYGSGGLMTYVDDFLYDGESILLPRKGTLDNVMYVNGKFWTVDTMYWTKVNTKLVDVKYLYLYLSLLDMSSKNSGSTLPSMTFDAYYSVEINLPSLEEQIKISKAIFLLIDKITLNNKINDTLQQQAKLLYDYWFNQFEFPNEEGKPYKSSGGKMVWNEELKREIPDGWEVMELSEILTFKSGYSFSSDDYSEVGSYKLITIKNVQDDGINLNVDNCLNEIPSNMPQYCLLKNKDILMSLTGNVGRIGLMYANNCLLNQRVALINPINENQRPYIYFLLKNELIRKKLEAISNGSSQSNLSPVEASKIKILYNKKIINNYSSEIEDYINHIVYNLCENQKLSQLRDFLLPMLMNRQATIED